MVMTTPTSSSFKHAPACSRISLLNRERRKAFAPFQTCKTSPSRRADQRQRCLHCRTYAQATAASQATSRIRPELRSANPQRPLSLSQNDQQQTAGIQGDAADRETPGKRVVIVGGGWAGE